jgi:hypothetical protein
VRERKELCYTNICTGKVLFDIFIAGIEALVIMGNKFVYACVKDVCHL